MHQLRQKFKLEGLQDHYRQSNSELKTLSSYVKAKRFIVDKRINLNDHFYCPVVKTFYRIFLIIKLSKI